MQLTITHLSHYSYDQPVGYALQRVRLRPVSSPLQDVRNWKLTVEGGAIEVSHLDHYGNMVDLISTDAGANELKITAHGTVLTHDRAGVLGQVYGAVPLWHFLRDTPLTLADAAITDLSAIIAKGESELDGLHRLSAAVLEAVPYEQGHTGSKSSAGDALGIGRGVCQDHAHIFISAARHAGIPARYVSGYLMLNDETEQDASHAWAEVHLDALGWVGFDVSNGMAPDESYVRLAIGHDAVDAAPVSGVRMGSAAESVLVSLQVQQ